MRASMYQIMICDTIGYCSTRNLFSMKQLSEKGNSQSTQSHSQVHYEMNVWRTPKKGFSSRNSPNICLVEMVFYGDVGCNTTVHAL